MAKKDKKATTATEEVVEEVVEEKKEEVKKEKVAEKKPEPVTKVLRIQMAVTGIKPQKGILTSVSRYEGDRVITDYK